MPFSPGTLPLSQTYDFIALHSAHANFIMGFINLISSLFLDIFCGSINLADLVKRRRILLDIVSVPGKKGFVIRTKSRDYKNILLQQNVYFYQQNV